jgi:small subunit ribosomal protein S8
MVNDPIADLLTRIRNGILRTKRVVIVPASKKLEAITSILKEESFIEDYSIRMSPDKDQKEILINLRYNENGKSVIHHLERISRPGLRIYRAYKEIPSILNGIGISIISTPKGIMSGKKARLEKVGGEYLCKIW